MHDKPAYEFLPHTADIKIRAYGITLEELFSHALQAMFVACEPQKSSPLTMVTHDLKLESTQISYLLIDFLAECLYLSDAHNEAYDHVEFTELSPTSLIAHLSGYKISGYAITEIKAVTYHDVSVEQIGEVWQATFVLDI